MSRRAEITLGFPTVCYHMQLLSGDRPVAVCEAIETLGRREGVAEGLGMEICLSCCRA